MGTILRAKCRNCGYNSESLRCWGGKLSYKTYCAYPVVDLNTDEVKTQNILQKEVILEESESFIFYDSEGLYQKNRVNEEYSFKWGKRVLYRGDVYICPKCQKYTLEFLSVGLWD